MTKRFTPKASNYTERMAEVQAKKAKLQRQLRALEAEEVALKAFLMPFYNTGDTEVDTGTTTLTVSYSEVPRTLLDQDRAIAIITKLGKKVPYFTVPVVSFKVKEAK
jgi:hypothetical protein